MGGELKVVTTWRGAMHKHRTKFLIYGLLEEGSEGFLGYLSLESEPLKFGKERAKLLVCLLIEE